MTWAAANFDRELAAAIELARQAGATILRFYGKPLHVDYKLDADGPVTEADREANALIVKGLENAFPRDGILAEESLDTSRRLECDRVWMVDPLDGTAGFISQNGDFAVQIGLAIKGRPALGVVYQPLPDLLFWAASGHGSWVSRQKQKPERLRVSDETKLSRMRLAASRNHRSSRMDTVLKALAPSDEVRRGSVGIKIGLIVQRQCDFYVNLSSRSQQWDTCAPESILTEAGGVMTDLWGELLGYNSADPRNRNGVLATNGAAHSIIAGELKPLLAEFGRTRIP